MPDRGQAWMAAFHVMRRLGLREVTNRAVATRMREVGVKPGSNRDLGRMVQEFKRYQGSIAHQFLPRVRQMAEGFARSILDTGAMADGARRPDDGEERRRIAKLTDSFARTLTEVAVAAVREIEPQGGGDTSEEPRRTRRPPKLPKTHLRLHVLQAAVESILSVERTGVRTEQPLSGSEIFSQLTASQRKLTNDDHIVRDLKQVALISKVIYRLPGYGGKWWRKDRPLPSTYGPQAKLAKSYQRRGTPLSLTQTENDDEKANVAALLLKAKGGLTTAEIVEALGVAPSQQRKFVLMLRNHRRAKEENKLFRYVDGRYMAPKNRK